MKTFLFVVITAVVTFLIARNLEEIQESIEDKIFELEVNQRVNWNS